MAFGAFCFPSLTFALPFRALNLRSGDMRGRPGVVGALHPYKWFCPMHSAPPFDKAFSFHWPLIARDRRAEGDSRKG